MLELIKIVFHCESLTPFISSGTNQREFELRSTSVKGLLRFWWRTFQNLHSTTELYKKESLLFGSSDQSVGASKLRVSLHYEPTKLKIIKPQTYLKESKLPDSLNYLLFSLLKWDNQRKDYQFQRAMALSPFDFTINLVMPKKYASEVLNSFWLLYVFGGIGARTRRGFGAFKIKDIKAYTFPSLKPTEEDQIESLKLFIQDTPDINSYITRGLSKIMPEQIKTEHHPSFASFMTARKRILIRQCTKKNPIESLSDVAKAIRDFRHKNPSDEVDALHAMISGKYPTINFKKPASGLPIIYNFRTDRDHQIEVSGKAGDTEYHRRSSPLMISLFEYTGNCCITILHLPSEFLPMGAKLHFKVKERGKKEPLAKYDAQFTQDVFINDLIDHLKKGFSPCKD